jgi:integrase
MMAIYPDRRAGQLTGRFRVEVETAGRRLRGRADNLSLAKALEASLRAGTQVSPALPATPVAYTLQECSQKASGILWVGQATEMESWNKLSTIVSVWGHSTPVDAIDTNMVDMLVAALKTKDLSDARVNRYLSTLSAFLTFCIDREYRTRKLPKIVWQEEGEGRIRWITPEEEAKLLSLLPQPYSDIAYLAIRTGMRAAELLTLKPEQIEPQWCRLWKTKNGSVRSIPLTPDTYSRLSSLVTSVSMPTYPQLRHYWDAARGQMGLTDPELFVFHACRHTFATRAIQAGVNIRVLQMLMGHKTIQTTIRYSHVDDRTLSDAIAKMAGFCPPPPSPSGGNTTC